MNCQYCTHYCFHGKDEYYGNLGTCRFNPPVFGGYKPDNFPIVRERSWCSKFKEKS